MYVCGCVWVSTPFVKLSNDRTCGFLFLIRLLLNVLIRHLSRLAFNRYIPSAIYFLRRSFHPTLLLLQSYSFSSLTPTPLLLVFTPLIVSSYSCSSSFLLLFSSPLLSSSFSSSFSYSFFSSSCSPLTTPIHKPVIFKRRIRCVCSPSSPQHRLDKPHLTSSRLIRRRLKHLTDLWKVLSAITTIPSRTTNPNHPYHPHNPNLNRPNNEVRMRLSA